MVEDENRTHFPCDQYPLMKSTGEEVPAVLQYVSEKRPAYLQAEFNDVYNYSNACNKSDVGKWFKRKFSNCGPITLLLSVFPIFQWLPQYKWKNDFYHDIISGTTVAIMHIPQGLAYSSLGLVPPITGIYMAFFPVIIYTLMGTSRHVSMGTFAVICMMSSKPILEYATFPDSISANNTTSSINGMEGYNLSPIEVGTAVCLIVGIWQVIFGLLRLGSLSVLMSEFLVSGFTTGAAVLVLTSQLKHIFGLKLPHHSGNLKTIFTFIDLFLNFKSANLYATAITAIIVILLILYTDFIKPIVSKKLPIPLPVELIVIIGGTLASIFLDLPTQFNIIVVGEIPTGIPPPTVPPLWLLPNLIVDGLVIAIVAFSINISMASIFAKKSKYKIDANQELLASGCGNVFGSFFSCIPFAASLSRSLIQHTVGGKTQLASVISCCSLVFVLLFIGPLFEQLPNCVLTGIIIVALRGMFLQAKDFWRAWKQSKRDGLIWMITFLSVIFFDIDKALIIGLVISVLSIVMVGQKPYVIVLGQIPSTSIYVNINCYNGGIKVPNKLILQIAGAMHFANNESIRQKIIKRLNQLEFEKEPTLESIEKSSGRKVNNLILDLTTVFYIDPSSVKTLTTIYSDMQSRDILLSLCGCNDKVYRVMKKCDFFLTFPESQLYPTVHDAVLLTNAAKHL